MKAKHLLLPVALCLTLLTGCMSTHQTMPLAVPTVRINLDDLEISEPLEATAMTVRVLGIDWERLFNTEDGDMAYSVLTPIPVVDKTDLYALYVLMKRNPGYDFVLYPQFTKVHRRPVLGIGALNSITEVKVTARLAKLKNK